MPKVCCVLLIFLCLSFSTDGKEPKYKAEGLFLVDDETVKSYMRDITDITDDVTKREHAMLELQKDINYTLSESNDTFQHPPLVPGTQNGIDKTMLLRQLESFLQLHNYSDTYKFDFAILWTGFDLHDSDDNSPDGSSYIGKICELESAIGVVEFHRTYETALTTAHEIGHILGSDHGSPASQNIMEATVNEASTQRWFFSNCSATDVKEYIDSLADNCLLNTSNASYQVNVRYPSYKGRMFNVDDICRRALKNTNAYMWRVWRPYNYSVPSGDKICSWINCHALGEKYYKEAISSEGMVCDAGKRCRKGKCKIKGNTPTTLTSTCLFGDQPLLELSIDNYTGTCEHYLNTTGAYKCYSKEVRQSCCRSCWALHTGIKDCAYGDYDNCHLYSKDAVCHRFTKYCCIYCQNYVANGRRSAGLNTTEIPQIKMPEETIVFNHTLMQSNKKKHKNRIVV